MSKGKHSAYQNENIRDFIAANIQCMTIDALRSGLLETFPGHDIPSRSSLGRYVAALPKKHPRLTKRHPAFRDHTVRKLVDTLGQQHMTVTQIGAVLTGCYPGKEMPPRSTLWNYLNAMGRKGRQNNWFQYPKVREFLRNADHSLSIDKLRAALKEFLPSGKVPGKNAISRYLVRNGGKKQRGNNFSKPIRIMLQRLMRDGYTIDEMRTRLAMRFPDRTIPSRSALGRYVKKARAT
ncbi:hypothetical protein MSKU15_0438 [Komagataeibacter diospyri]|uniref:hypothetical protein n=1 Tax=Komagataeibacter diospyri TaxID=1932662 RepID=UPI0011397E35|nr:hypothetical protein [Komagataeibacter diospyri]GCE88837.1 hypothetical protein MSKU15_0438 [Komagataeibacter diospyri]